MSIINRYNRWAQFQLIKSSEQSLHCTPSAAEDRHSTMKENYLIETTSNSNNTRHNHWPISILNRSGFESEEPALVDQQSIQPPFAIGRFYGQLFVVVKESQRQFQHVRKGAAAQHHRHEQHQQRHIFPVVISRGRYVSRVIFSYPYFYWFYWFYLFTVYPAPSLGRHFVSLEQQSAAPIDFFKYFISIYLLIFFTWSPTNQLNRCTLCYRVHWYSSTVSPFFCCCRYCGLVR